MYGLRDNYNNEDTIYSWSQKENIYETIQIGEQVWMAENLKTTRYSNGDEIIYIDNPNNWKGN